MLLELRARRDAHEGGVRRGRPRRRPHVRRRGARLPRGPAGPAVRRPGRQAARAAARVHRHDARAGLHRQRPQEPPAQQPRPASRGDRRLPAVPVAADRDHPAQGHLHAGQLRDQAAERRPDAASPRCTGSRGRRRSRDTGCTCTRSSIRPRRCTRRPTWRRSKRTSCGCPSSWRTPRRSPGKRRPRRRPRSGRRGSRPSACARRRPLPTSRRPTIAPAPAFDDAPRRPRPQSPHAAARALRIRRRGAGAARSRRPSAPVAPRRRLGSGARPAPAPRPRRIRLPSPRPSRDDPAPASPPAPEAGPPAEPEQLGLF